MIRNGVRFLIFALEAVGLVFGALIGLLFFVFWRAQSGPVSLAWASPAIAKVVIDSSSAFDDCTIDEILLRQAGASGRYTLFVNGLSLQRDGETVASVDQTALTFAMKDFMSARFGPEVIHISDVVLRVVRGADRRLNLDYGAQASTPAPVRDDNAGVFQSLTGGPYFREAFQHAVLERARLEFFDVTTGRAWAAPNARAEIARTPEGYRALVHGDIAPTRLRTPAPTSEQAPARLEMAANYTLSTDEIATDITLTRAPLGDILNVFFGARADVLSSDVTGHGAIAFTSDGKVLSSELKGAAGAGMVRLGSFETALERAAVDMSFDPALNQFSLRRLAVQTDAFSGLLHGGATLIYGEPADGAPPSNENAIGALTAIEFNLAGEEIMVTGAPAQALNPPIPNGQISTGRPSPEELSIVKLSNGQLSNGQPEKGQAGSWLAPTVPIDVLAVNGVYHAPDRTVSINIDQLSLYDAAISGTLKVVAPPSASVGVAAELSIAGALRRLQLLSVWPTSLADGARTFVRDRVDGGRFSGITASVDIPTGMLANMSADGSDGKGVAPNDHHDDEPNAADTGLSNDALRLNFFAEDARVTYAPGMAPLDAVVGNGTLAGNSFVFYADRGRVGDVALAGGSVEIPRLRPRGQPSIFKFTAVGDAGDILTVLNDPPLNVLRATPLSPDQFTGNIRLDATITRPNQIDTLPSDYTYAANATFTDLSVTDFLNDTPIESGSGALTLETGGMRVTGDAKYAAAPITFDWSQQFQADGDPTEIKIHGTANAETADILGASTRQFIRGAIPFSVNAKGDLSAMRLVEVEADLTDALFAVLPLNWRKSRGAPAIGVFSLDRTAPEQAQYAISLNGEGVRITGDARLDATGALSSVDFSEFYLQGAADLSVKLSRMADRSPSIAVTGRFLDVGPILESFFDPGQNQNPAPNDVGPSGDWSQFLEGLSGVGRLDEIGLRGGVRLQDAALDLRHGVSQLDSLELVALDGDGHPLSVSLNRTGEEAQRQQNVVARTDNIGALLAGVLGIQSIDGGQGVIELDFSNPITDDEEAVLMADGTVHESTLSGHVGLHAAGQLEARNMRIVGAPILARVFSAGSLTGLSDLLSGGGIEISQTFADFAINAETISLYDARAAGPSVGLTGKGKFQLGEDATVDLSGAVAPAYQINSFLGRAPLIGDLFINRNGEGVFALAYDIEGQASEPTVTVNPLSAFTPGVFRRMFESPPEAAPQMTPPDGDQQQGDQRKDGQR